MGELGQIVERLIKEGYAADMGAHRGSCKGFYATVYLPDEDPCEECESSCPTSWEKSGHGWTLLEALKNAEMIAKGAASSARVGTFV